MFCLYSRYFFLDNRGWLTKLWDIRNRLWWLLDRRAPIYVKKLPFNIFYPFRRPHTLYALHLLCLHYIQRSKRNSLSKSRLSYLMVKNQWDPKYQPCRRAWMLTWIQTYEQMPLLTYSMAVFNETLRLFPPVSISSHTKERCCVTPQQATSIHRCATEDTSLVAAISAARNVLYQLPRTLASWCLSLGYIIIVRLPTYSLSLHWTLARYWKDPHTFRPSRFLEDWPRDAFLPFGSGKLLP